MNPPDNGYWAAKERRGIEKRQREMISAARMSADTSIQRATAMLADRLEPYRVYIPRKLLRRKLREVFDKFARLGYDGNTAYRMAMDAIFAGLTTYHESNTPPIPLAPPVPVPAAAAASAAPTPRLHLNASASSYVPRPTIRLNPNAPVFVPSLPTSGPTPTPPTFHPFFNGNDVAAEDEDEDEDEYINKLFAAEPLKKEGGRGRNKQTRRLKYQHRSRRSRPQYRPQ
jgi:hypothetical protein